MRYDVRSAVLFVPETPPASLSFIRSIRHCDIPTTPNAQCISNNTNLSVRCGQIPYLGILAKSVFSQIHPGRLVHLFQQSAVHDVYVLMRNMQREIEMHKSAELGLHDLQ